MNGDLFGKVDQLIPSIQENPPTTPGEIKFWEDFTRGFREGWDPTPILFWTFVFVLAGVGIWGIIKVIEWQSGPSTKKGKKYDVLEALQQNLVLSKSQRQYLEALIEKYKNRNPYEPEVSTEYLREFLEFSIHNLTHSPTQTLRRRIHRTPNFEEGHHVELMVEKSGGYHTFSFKIESQDEKYVVLKPTPGDDAELKEGDNVEITYRQDHLYLRGEAEIRQATDNEVILYLPEGLHFEEQRSYRRMDTNSIPCDLSLRNHEDKKVKTSGTIEDISAEGARVIIGTDRGKCDTNMRGTIEFELPGFSKLSLFAEIVRAEERADESQELGIHFTRVSMGDRERIFQFINQKEKES
jgi:c-di-GMP-binding flagellar brake protein YcgR